MSNDPFIQQEEQSNFNIQRYLFQLLKNWYYVVLALLLGVTIAILNNRYSQTEYQAQVSVIIDDQDNVQNMFDRMYTPWTKQRSQVQNEQIVLKSYNLARRTLEKMSLDVLYYGIGRLKNTQIYPYVGFEVKILDDNIKKSKLYIDILSKEKYRLYDEDHETIDTVMPFGKPYKQGGFHFEINLLSENLIGKKYSFVFSDYNALANQYKSKINISLYNEFGSVLMLKIKGSNKNLIVDYLNTLSEEYIDYSLEKKIENTKNSLDFIRQQEKRLVDSLNKIESQLFRIKFNSPGLNISEKGELQLKNLNELTSQKKDLDSYAEKQNKLVQLIKDLGIYDKLVILSLMDEQNPMLQSEIQTLKELIEQKENFQAQIKKNIPGAHDLKTQIEEREGKIQENINIALDYNKWLQNHIDSTLIVFKNDILATSSSSNQGLNIQRKYEVFRTFYNILLEKEAQISIQQSSISSNKRVLDQARVENAILLSPQKSENYKKYILLSLFISIGIILGLFYFNPRIIDKEDIISKTNVPLLGLIGHNTTQYNIPVFEKPRSAMAEAFRRIRTNLTFILREQNHKVVMVTSTISGEGKTFSSINLAVVLALTDKKVLLMGMDLRKPNIHRIFNIENDKGISNYLAGRAEYNDILKQVNIKNLTLAISGPMPPNPAELIEGERFTELIKQARKDFDYIVIDTPPVALVTDALLVADHCDTTIFMVRQNYTNKKALDMVNEYYISKKIKNLNILVNDVHISKTMGYHYSYGYNYGYGYGYGKYYGSDTRYVDDDEDMKIRKKRNRKT